MRFATCSRWPNTDPISLGALADSGARGWVPVIVKFFTAVSSSSNGFAIVFAKARARTMDTSSAMNSQFKATKYSPARPPSISFSERYRNICHPFVAVALAARYLSAPPSVRVPSKLKTSLIVQVIARCQQRRGGKIINRHAVDWFAGKNRVAVAVGNDRADAVVES